MPQTFVQETDIFLSNKTQFTIYVSNTVGTSDFEAELFLHENANGLSKSELKQITKVELLPFKRQLILS